MPHAHKGGVRWPLALIAAAALCAGVLLSLHHPAWPGPALLLFVLWCAAAMRWGSLWLFVLPACLPAMNFGPWTGWIVFEEFDLAVLGAVAGGFARLALARDGDGDGAASLPRPVALLAALCGVLGAVAALRGLAAAGIAGAGWYDGEADPLNAWRVFKSLLHVLLLLPLLQHELRLSREHVVRRLGAGMVAGAGIVVAACLWERAQTPGLFDFSDSYRTVALFWEMHVGGAAIDGYLAIAVPFVAWAVASARTPWRWTGAAAFALLTEYVCLTTFSRGVYLGVAGGLVAFTVLRARSPAQTSGRIRRRANRGLIALLLLELAAIAGSDSFMVARLRQSPQDFGSRLAHWQHGLSLLDGPLPWAIGRGLGRLPADYAASGPAHEFSGRAQVVGAPGQRHLQLRGPDHAASLAGLYSITQRVTLDAAAGYRAALDVRADQPAQLAVSLCRTHLLYDGACLRGVVQVRPDTERWQHVSLQLQGPPLSSGAWPTRTAVFAVSVRDAGVAVDIDKLALQGEGPANLLRNADFSHELAHWFPVAQRYFVPWHIDNLCLELLIEQGVSGLAAVALLFAVAFASLLSPRNRGLPLTPVLVASLVGALLVGLVSSLLDVPRVAFLLFFLAFLSIQFAHAHDSPGPP